MKMKKQGLWLISIVLFVLTSCNSNQAPSDVSLESVQEIKVEPVREATDKLTQEHANTRKKRVSNIEYTLDIDLVSLTDAYQGKVEINFALKTNNQNLTIDFTGGEVQSTNINGENNPVNYNGFFITLPAKALNTGPNKIVIEYSHPYNQDGTGLHRFIEPEDNRTYLYTYLWPYYSNRLFPNFDQPNLKATYEMTVRAQSDWQVISSMMEDQVSDEGDSKLWHFPRVKNSQAIYSRCMLALIKCGKTWLVIYQLGYFLDNLWLNMSQ